MVSACLATQATKFSLFLKKNLLVLFSITFPLFLSIWKLWYVFSANHTFIFSSAQRLRDECLSRSLSPTHTHTHTRLSSSFDCCPLGLALQQERCSTLPSHSLSSLLFSSLSWQIWGDLIVLLCLKISLMLICLCFRSFGGVLKPLWTQVHS